MLLKLKKAATSITVRLMLIFFAIWMVVTAIITSSMYAMTRRMSNKTIESQQNKVSYYAAIVNADLNRITDLMQQMSVDSDVAAYLVSRSQGGKFSYENYEAYLDSYEKLKSYWKTSMYIDDAFLVLPGKEEVLRATKGVVSLPEGYQEQVDICTEAGDAFFSIGSRMVFLSCGANGVIVGIEISARHLRAVLNSLDSGYFDCFFVNSKTGALLEDEQVSELAFHIYEEIQEKNNDDHTVTAEGIKYLYESVDTSGGYFRVYLFAKKETVYAELYFAQKNWLALTIMVLLVPVLVGMLFSRTISRPMKKLTTAMQNFENQNWKYRLNEDEPSEFNYVFKQYNSMASEIERLIQEVYEKQIVAEQARRRQLQAQINPHFLFNSFYMGYRMAKSKDCERVAERCMYLGDYFKALTYLSEDSISLEKEMKFTEKYLELNRMRFEKKLRYDISVEQGLEKAFVSPLLIQPLVENAIRHGVEQADYPCRVNVTIKKKSDSWMMCEVVDDCGKTNEETYERLQKLIQETKMPEECFGLWNVQQRLRDAGGSGLCFKREKNDAGDSYFKVSFELQLIKRK